MSTHQKEVAGYFANLAPVYGEGRFYRMRREAVHRAISPEIGEARLMLDLGCGNGAYMAEFSALMRRRSHPLTLVGADLSFAMLQAARGLRGVRAHLVQADATALPFGRGLFDLVFCSHVLQFIPDLQRAAGEIASVVRRGGCFIATFGVSGLRRELPKVMGAAHWREFDRIVFAAQRRSEVHDPTEAAYRGIFARAGFEAKRRDARFAPQWEDVEEWLRLRWLSAVSEETRERAERIVADVRGGLGKSHSLDLNEPLLVGRKRAQ